MPANRASVEFGGTARFVLEGRLGEGGMGVVYRARDSESALPVALKTMAYVDPSALLRFKNEFRALADISHPNVVQLYDLVSEGEHWFFTMELLNGVDFLRWVQRGDLEPAAPSPLSTPWSEQSVTSDSASLSLDFAPLPEATSKTSGVMSATRNMAPAKMCDIERLRPALVQLAQGVTAIHAAGKLHRDIKPSNVLVTFDERVVLLDFGVVGDLQAARDKPRFEAQILGTPAYMAPEQARGTPAGAPADWYSVGVIMYESMTNHLPFEGSPHDILFSRLGARAARPSELVPEVPEDLDTLCMELLHPDPRQRPRGQDVLRRLSRGGEPERHTPVLNALTTGARRPFVGRKQQLAVLEAAFEHSAQGRAVVVLMAGRSGMGKTVLAQHFLGQPSKQRAALVFSGRCFEREALPFKGMDSVVDELSRYLTHSPPRNIVDVLPAGLHYLARVFPVLRAVPCLENLSAREHEIAEPIELRKRAFAALKELLVALSARQPLIVHIDDVQWSDIDSLVLLEQLLQPPHAPNLLLVCSFREEVRQSSPILGELFTILKRLSARLEVRELSVDQLSSEEAVELAQLSLDGEPGVPSELAYAIALEAQGVPIFVSELAQWQLDRRGRSEAEETRGVSLEQVIQKRLAELPSEACALLQVLSVANGPVRYGLAEQAAGTARNDALRARLRATRLVRTFRADGQEFAEAYHARVRESVMATLSTEQRRSWHRSLASALEASGTADPEALVEHYLAAGETARARRHVLSAAQAAESGLAFMRAARLYRVATEIGVDRPRHELLAGVGDALVHAGRSSDAADAYQEAARAAPGERAVELQRRAAEHLLKSGRDREGLAELRAVLHRVGLKYPQSSRGALGSLLYHRLRMRLRGLSFKPTASELCRPSDLIRVDVAFSATSGLAMVDVVRGADFGAQHLLLALDSGEPMRICRALAFEAGNAAAVGAGSRDRVERLVRTAEGLSLRSQDPHGTALAKIAGGLVRVFSGEWRAAQRMLDEAEVLLRERCRAVTWELTNTQAWSCNSLILCGDLREAAARMPTLIREAMDRSDRYALMHLIYPACITALAVNDVETGWRVASDDSTFRSCEPGKFTAGHWGRLISTQSVHRYRGEGKRARAFVEDNWQGLESSQFLRVHLMRVFSEFERALSVISAIDEGETGRDAEREAERSVKRVLSDSPQYAPAMGHFIAGCLAAVRADRARALGEFERAAPGLEAVDMGYLALCARQRYAELLGGDAGRELVRKCGEDFAARGVADIAACLMMSAPGFRRIST